MLKRWAKNIYVYVYLGISYEYVPKLYNMYIQAATPEVKINRKRNVLCIFIDGEFNYRKI